MRAVIIEEFGRPGGMKMRDVAEPTAAAGQVLIRTEAIGVGGVDAVIRRGLLGPGQASMIPGSEVAGVVAEIGDDVSPAWLGRRVWAFTGTSGAYAQSAVARVADVTALPDDLSFVDAVTLGSAATVAHFALAHAHLSAGDAVLVRGAAGSLGIAAIELAARGGAGVVAVTTSSQDRGRRLRSLGATHLLDRHGRAHGDGTPPHAPESDYTFDVVIDIVGGAELPDFLDRLRPNGRAVLVGAVAGFPPADFGMSLIRAFQQSRSFATFSLNTVAPDERNRVRGELFAAAARGELTPVVHAVLPLHHAAEAHEQMDAGTVFGRIVLDPVAPTSGG